MSRRFTFRFPVLWVAVAGFLVAASAALAALVRALEVRQPPPASAEAIAIPRIALSRRGGSKAVWVNDDPFSPERSPPATRYRLTGTAGVPNAPARHEQDQQQPLAVLGTVVATDGSSFAVCMLADGVPRQVRVGGRLGEYVVETIERGRVVFVTPSGQRLDVRTTSVGN